jgi:hypothetical protein
MYYNEKMLPRFEFMSIEHLTKSYGTATAASVRAGPRHFWRTLDPAADQHSHAISSFIHPRREPSYVCSSMCLNSASLVLVLL